MMNRSNKKFSRMVYWIFAALLVMHPVFFTGAAQAYVAQAPDFDSGSNGEDGSFEPPDNVPAGTLVDAEAMTAVVPLSRPDRQNGVFNFTTFTAPAEWTVSFSVNGPNTPVVILASGAVTIAGTLSVDGEPGGLLTSHVAGRGGPGGFDGGDGGIVGVAREGTAGGGPGGGAGAVIRGSQGLGGGGGSFGTSGGQGQGSGETPGGAPGTVYGTRTLVPLIGGAGGGGGAAQNINNGGGGGGGGGSLLIASSESITISGSILARGGIGGNAAGCCSAGSGGGGAGGAVRLIADTIAGSGPISAAGGPTNFDDFNGGGGGLGRVRLEAFNITYNGPVTGVATQSAPGSIAPVTPTLRITRIAGVDTPANPAGRFGQSPDIILPAPPAMEQLTVTIEVTATNVPPSTIVDVTVTPEAGTQQIVASMSLQGTMETSTATAQATLPQGVNIIGASATFALPGEGSASARSLFINGERVKQMRVGTRLGQAGSEVVYITESGRRVPVR